MSVNLLTVQHFEFLRLKGGCVCSSSQSTLVKMPHWWKSHDAVQMLLHSSDPDQDFLQRLSADNKVAASKERVNVPAKLHLNS